jgi:hypothetical protein
VDDLNAASSADRSEFDYRRQVADLEYLVSSRAAMTSFAESYVGARFDFSQRIRGYLRRSRSSAAA